MKGNNLLVIFAISALLVSISATNFAYAGDSSDNDEERKEKIAKDKEFKKELREEYKIKLEEKKKIFVDYKKELKEKYKELKNEFKEKYAQLRISTISDVDEDSEDEIESEIKRNELRLLKHEFRENIKNLKLESKQHFDELKNQLKSQDTDRKNKIHEIINELKEKYKNKIREHDHPNTSDLDSYPIDYESKKIEICHVPPGNPDNAHTLSISVNAMRAHLAHGDYIDECAENGDDETNDEEEIEIKVEIEDGIAKIEVKIGDEELEFELEETDRELIIQYIADNTDFTIEEIETYIEFEEYENDEGQTIVIELKEELGISQE
ncbi:hypothetical protein MnTg01_00046 [archaeon MnTg01]|nr:hypothetical protein MnTg01_00046 [archaeon MnTg01]